MTSPSVQQSLDGVNADGTPESWRQSVLLATYKGPGVANLPVPFEVPWPTTSDFDPTTVMGTIFTQLTTDGRTGFDLLVDIDAKLTQLVGATATVIAAPVVIPTVDVTPVVVSPTPAVVPVAPVAPEAPKETLAQALAALAAIFSTKGN